MNAAVRSRARARRRRPVKPTRVRDAPVTTIRAAAIAAALALLAGGAVLAFTYGGSPAAAAGGVELIAVTGVAKGDIATATRLGRATRGAADEQGTVVLRGLAPGRHEIEVSRGGRRVVRTSATVLAPEGHPSPSWYEGRTLGPGRNEITTRDGTRLSAFVRLPGPPEQGPYPTVVEYSGYRIADAGVHQPASAVAAALGYATVGVNVRGSGCSGGAFELLGAATAADGYDVIETIARQPWARGAKVGLVGFSYGGLGALEVAATRPPSLSAVAALSVYGNAWEALHPGGLDNAGFPVSWLRDLQRDATPAGADWIAERIAAGDQACARNQLLHGQAVSLADTYLGPVPDDGRFDALSVTSFLPTIDAPTFLAAMTHDATVGNDLADAFNTFTGERLTLVLANGGHGDGVAPQVLRRMDQFLSLYVADRTPGGFDTRRIVRSLRPDAAAEADKVQEGPPPPVEFGPDMSLAEARARYEASPPVEFLYESGNVRAAPGAAAAAASATFATWPPPGVGPSTFALAADGTLSGSAEVTSPSSTATFRTAPEVSTEAYDTDGTTLVDNIVSRWVVPDPEASRSWLTDPIVDPVTLTGTGSVDLWIRSDAADPQLQVGLSEVRPTGDETLVQVGWLDTRYRSLDPSSTPLRPVHRWDQPRRVPIGAWVQVRVRLGPMGHIVRAGSRLRLVLGTPGAGQVPWSFAPPEHGAAQIDVGQGGEHASILRLPIGSTAEVPERTPGCGDLRAQPCRPFQGPAGDASDPAAGEAPGP